MPLNSFTMTVTVDKSYKQRRCRNIRIGLLKSGKNLLNSAMIWCRSQGVLWIREVLHSTTVGKVEVRQLAALSAEFCPITGSEEWLIVAGSWKSSKSCDSYKLVTWRSWNRWGSGLIIRRWTGVCRRFMQRQMKWQEARWKGSSGSPMMMIDN